MKVVAFNGSPKKDGNTVRLIKHVFAELEAQDIDCELVHLYGNITSGCSSCGTCRSKQDLRCAIDNDIINECIDKIKEADGILIGSPTYFAGLTPETKAFIDRVGYAGRFTLLQRKVGAAVVAVRRAGALNVFNSINAFFLINQMIVPGSSYWNLGIGRLPGEVENDEEGIETMRVLGRNMAWLLKRLAP